METFQEYHQRSSCIFFFVSVSPEDNIFPSVQVAERSTFGNMKKRLGNCVTAADPKDDKTDQSNSDQDSSSEKKKSEGFFRKGKKKAASSRYSIHMHVY